MPFALYEGGAIGGLVLIIGIGLCTNASVQMLVSIGIAQKRVYYEQLCEYAFGRKGFYIISIAMFAFAFGAMISFLVIIGDTLTYLVTFFAPQFTDHTFVRRIALLTVAVVCLIPLALVKNMAKLANASIVSLFSATIILSVVTCVRAREPMCMS